MNIAYEDNKEDKHLQIKFYLTSILINRIVIIFKIIKLYFVLYSAVSFV